MINIKSKDIVLIDVDKVVANPKNTNKHSQDQIKRLEKLIKHNGFRDPLIISNRSGFLIAGHGRLEVAKNLKMDKIPVIYQDFENEAEEFQFMTAHNAIARWSELDNDLILEGLKEFEFDSELLAIEDFKMPEMEQEKEVKDIDPHTDKEFSLLILCKDEFQQKEWFERLSSEEELECRIL